MCPIGPDIELRFESRRARHGHFDSALACAPGAILSRSVSSRYRGAQATMRETFERSFSLSNETRTIWPISGRPRLSPTGRVVKRPGRSVLLRRRLRADPADALDAGGRSAALARQGALVELRRAEGRQGAARSGAAVGDRAVAAAALVARVAGGAVGLAGVEHPVAARVAGEELL